MSIQGLSQDILQHYETNNDNLNDSYLKTDCASSFPNDEDLTETGCECDKLLRLFHRFDEDLSAKGKWQGGSVTGVCRGWGTPKYMSLESVYYISEAVLSIEARVEDCLQDIVDDFNRNPEQFSVPEEPCRGILLDGENNPTFDFIIDFNGLTVANIMADFKQKFDCLKFSFFYKADYCPRDASCDIPNETTV